MADLLTHTDSNARHESVSSADVKAISSSAINGRSSIVTDSDQSNTHVTANLTPIYQSMYVSSGISFISGIFVLAELCM
jgi:hypothetical protein